MKTNREAGERLRALREQRGLTRSALGREVGCTGWAISLYEKGKREPKAAYAFRLYELTRKWGEAIKPTDWERCA